MIITKISQTHFNNGLYDLETKSYLKHDLVHFAVDKALGLYNDEDPTTHSEELEKVAGILHAVYDESVTNARILEGADNLFSAFGKERPFYLTDDFVQDIRTTVHTLFHRYAALKTGESMELA